MANTPRPTFKALPVRASSPASASSTSSKLARTPGAGRAMAARKKATSFWSSLRATDSTKPKPTTTSLQRPSPPSAAIARASQTDTLGSVFARSVGPGVAAGTMGALDHTEFGQKFRAATGDWISPSTALTIAGGVARGLGVDRKYLGKHITGANTKLLTGMFPVLMYKAGSNLPGALASQNTAQRNRADKTAAPVKDAPAPAVSHVVVEPIPGEATAS